MKNNLTIKKPKGKIRGLLSKLLNFICALIIFFVILFSIGAFIQADVESKNILGNHEYQIFSYNTTDDGTAVFKAFGESIAIDLTKIDSIRERIEEISAVNKDYTPSFISLGGDILSGCFSSVGGSFKKIPGIINYFIEQANGDNP